MCIKDNQNNLSQSFWRNPSTRKLSLANVWLSGYQVHLNYNLKMFGNSYGVNQDLDHCAKQNPFAIMTSVCKNIMHYG